MNILNIENHDIRERKLRPDDVLGHMTPDQKERIILWLGTLSLSGHIGKTTRKAPPPEDLLNSAILSTSCAQTKPSLPGSDDKITRSNYI